jgi:hypothetical protein
VAGSVGVLTYLAGGPLIHFAHGEGARGVASAALRIGLPYLGSMLGGNGHSADAGGIAIGGVAAILIDWAFITPGDRVRVVPRPSVAPQFVARPGYLGLGLGGAF